MGSMSMAHWGILLVAALLLFGRGKFSAAMGDIGQGLKSFRKGLTDEAPASVSDAARAVRETLPHPKPKRAE